MHNDLRAAHGVPPLQWDASLAAKAQAHSNTCEHRMRYCMPCEIALILRAHAAVENELTPRARRTCRCKWGHSSGNDLGRARAGESIVRWGRPAGMVEQSCTVDSVRLCCENEETEPVQLQLLCLSLRGPSLTARPTHFVCSLPTPCRLSCTGAWTPAATPLGLCTWK